jgi:hypothetical protein
VAAAAAAAGAVASADGRFFVVDSVDKPVSVTLCSAACSLVGAAGYLRFEYAGKACVGTRAGSNRTDLACRFWYYQLVLANNGYGLTGLVY